MKNTNVIVLHSSLVVSSLEFEYPSSLVNFVGTYIDQHNTFDYTISMCLVHRNGQVLRKIFLNIDQLIEFTKGIQVAGWLSEFEGSLPNMDYLGWADHTDIAVVYDSRFESVDVDEPNEYGEYPE